MTVAGNESENDDAGEIRVRETDLIDARQAAALLEVDAATIHRWGAGKKGPRPEVDRPNLKLWRWGELKKWAQANKKGRFKKPREIRDSSTIQHGTRLGYQQGCRLKCCRDANTAYQREYVARKKGAEGA